MQKIERRHRESILLNSAIAIANYGLPTQREIGITKGGVSFTVTETVRQIEFDGSPGKVKGMETVDEIGASATMNTLVLSQENILMTLRAAKMNEDNSITNRENGVVQDEDYLENVTLFGICNKKSKFKKITIYNPGAAGGLTLNTQDKSEAVIALTLDAHWDGDYPMDSIYKIEDDTTGPSALPDTLRALTVRTQAGSAGETIVNVVDAMGSGRGLVYMLDDAAQTVVYNEDLSGWDTLISGQSMEAVAGQIITVAEVDAQRKAKGAGSTAVVAGA